MQTFQELGLNEKILKSIQFAGYTTPTPIQVQAIPVLLQNRDLLGSAQTGTGKTAAFAIPILQHILETRSLVEGTPIQALVLAPTRELATQIAENFSTYAKYINIKNTTVYGGVKQKKQVDALKQGVDVLIATPGRLMDLMSQGYIKLNKVKYLVLDEADQMLDMGFIKDIQKIVKHIPKDRQSMMFSATMPKEIEKLANEMLVDPVRIAVTPVTKTLDIITQRLYHVAKKQKPNLLVELMADEQIKRALVFTRTKRNADLLVKELVARGIEAEPIHGNKSQTARDKALESFKKGKTRILVATDIAARGIDIDSLEYVFNFELPEMPETHIHRIGRTGRAGALGQAISFADPGEVDLLKAIEKHTGVKIKVYPHRFMNEQNLKLSGLDNNLVHNPELGFTEIKKEVKKDQSKNKNNTNKNTKPKRDLNTPDYLRFKDYKGKNQKAKESKEKEKSANPVSKKTQAKIVAKADAFEKYKQKRNPNYQVKNK